MRISELIKLLQAYKQKHGDMQLVYTRYSDYGVLDADEITVKEATPVKGSAGKWMIGGDFRSVTPVETEKVLHFEGN